MYLSAILSSIAAWFVGLLIDVNLSGNPVGLLALRVLFPILTMGCFLLKAIRDTTKSNDKENKAD